MTGEVKADVVIVGGGFTGLWTAYFPTERNPNLGVVALEQDICGGGPSGRNGGFASGWWDELRGLVTQYGADPAVKACRAISKSIGGIEEFCEKHGVDAWFHRGGYMYAITAAAHERLRDEMVELAAEVGAEDELVALTPAELKVRRQRKEGANPGLSLRSSRRRHAGWATYWAGLDLRGGGRPTLSASGAPTSQRPGT